jgi:hypothetical protein
MKHLWKGAVALALLGGSIAAVGPGCVANESSIYIKTVLTPSCAVVTTDSDQRAVGLLDVAYSCEYTATLVVANQLVKRGDDNKLQVETSRVELKSFDVQILDGGRAPLGGGVDKYTVSAAGEIDPETGGTPGLALTEVLLVDGAVGQYLYENNITDIVVRIKAHARTLGGQDLTSGEYDYPIKVCSHCLCQEPADDSCSMPTSAPKEQCWLKNDYFDCRWLKGGDCKTPYKCGVAL